MKAQAATAITPDAVRTRGDGDGAFGDAFYPYRDALP